MKNLSSILLLVFTVTFTTQAQRKKGDRNSKLTIEQQTSLTVKRMTLALDLSEGQQNEIKPLLMAKMAGRNTAIKERRAAKKNKEQPTADEIYAIQSKLLDHKIFMRDKMKNILNKEQFEKFDKMQKKSNKIASRKMNHKEDRRHNKNRKSKEKIKESK